MGLSLFAGHPALTVQRSLIYANMAIDSSATAQEKANLAARARTTGRNGLAWTGQLSYEAVYIARSLDYFLPNDDDLAEIDPVTLVSSSLNVWPTGGAYIAFGDRVTSYPDEMLASGVTSGSLYKSYGRYLFRHGQYKQARDILLSLPAFQRAESPPTIADENNAISFAAWFYRIGQHEHAVPLLEISANGVSGSNSSMQSRQALALLRGDYETAMEMALERTRRYGNEQAISDLLTYMHVLGKSDLASSVFEQVFPSKNGDRMWKSALFGHRVQGKSFDDLVNWLWSSAQFRDAVGARAMTVFLQEDYETAFAEFNRAARFYLLDEYLPYFAIRCRQNR